MTYAHTSRHGCFPGGQRSDFGAPRAWLLMAAQSWGGRGYDGPGRHRHGPRGGGRRRRGDARAAILVLLAEAPRNGYGITQEIEERSAGAWRPSPGSVYPVLQQLEDEGLVRADDSG